MSAPPLEMAPVADVELDTDDGMADSREIEVAIAVSDVDDEGGAVAIVKVLLPVGEADSVDDRTAGSEDSDSMP